MGDLMFLLPDTLDYAVCIKVINVRRLAHHPQEFMLTTDR